MLLSVPVVGPLLAAYEHARLCLFMAMLYDCGAPMGEAIEGAANTLTNHYLRRRLHLVAAQVKSGTPPSAAFTLLPVAPQGLARSLALGEQTGNFAAPLEELHASLKTHADDRLDALLQLLRPALLAFSAAMLFGGIGGF